MPPCFNPVTFQVLVPLKWDYSNITSLVLNEPFPKPITSQKALRTPFRCSYQNAFGCSSAGIQVVRLRPRLLGQDFALPSASSQFAPRRHAAGLLHGRYLSEHTVYEAELCAQSLCYMQGNTFRRSSWTMPSVPYSSLIQ
eukprot:719777-Amphidinium_carterae.2